MKAAAFIPARMGSTRFQNKPMALINNEPMILHVCRAASKCSFLSAVITATDSGEIYNTVTSAGYKAVMTSSEHPSGLDRIIEAAEKSPPFTHYVNIQGDEPMVHADTIGGMLKLFKKYDDCDISTAAVKFRDDEEIHNPDRVKVTLSKTGRALYFSRAPIPYRRDKTTGPDILKHQGLYAYSVSALHKAKTLERGLLERTESLEQLRFLENNMNIYVHITEHESIGVDRPEDIALVEQELRRDA